MSYETDFDTAFTILLGKAIGVITPTGIVPLPQPTGDGTITVPNTAGIEFVIDGGGSAITTGVKGGLIVPFDCEITKVELQEFIGTSGTLSIDIRKASTGTGPAFTSIIGTVGPFLASNRYYSDTALNGWTTTLSRGDGLQYVVSSAITVTAVTVMLYVRRTDVT